MNIKLIGYVYLIVAGAVCAVLSGWVYLLERETLWLLFALLGIVGLVAGIVRLVRERASA